LVIDAFERGEVGVALQPLVELGTGRVVGYEALCRPPARFGGPEAFFGRCLKEGCGEEADRRMWRLAFLAFMRSRRRGLLFLNATLPGFLAGPGVLARGAPPVPAVVELSERGSCGPEEIVRAALLWRQEGFRVAFDDVWPGCPGLSAATRVMPEYLKAGKRALREGGGAFLRELVRTAATWNGVVVAEGIESRRDIEVVRDAGVQVGQGWYFGRPVPVVC